MAKARVKSGGKGDGKGGNTGGGGTKATSKPAEKVGPVKFVAQARQEGRKVTWTSWKETVQTTILVLIMVLLFGLFFFVVDSIFGTGTKWFLQYFGAGV